jgi:ABC-2 type transport system permease protein
MPDALRAEWTKLRTSPATIWLLLGVVAATVGVSWAVTSAGSTGDLTKNSLTGVYLGQAVVASFGVLVIGGEYATGMVRVTLTAVPRRIAMLAAKAAVLTFAVLPASAAAVLGCALVGAVPLNEGVVVRAVGGSVLYLGLIALLALGTGVAVRDSTTAIGVVLGLLYVLPILAEVVGNHAWQRHLLQVAPMSAGLAIQSTRDLQDLPIAPWAGLGVLAAWAVGALIVGGVVLQRRDA